MEGGRLENNKSLDSLTHSTHGTASLNQPETPRPHSMLEHYLPTSIRAQKYIYLINVFALGMSLGFSIMVYSATGTLAQYWWLALVNIPGCVRLLAIL